MMATEESSVVVDSTTQEAFKGTNVLITGASGGLGRSLALRFAQAQCATLVLSARKQDALDEVATACRRYLPSTHRVYVIVCDLSDSKSVEKLGKRVEEYNINVLVNNGGVSSRSRFVDTDISVDQRLLQINFLSGAALSKAVVPGMQEQQGGGKIIWVSSVQGLVGIPNRSSYAASKFAVQGYCESIRAELASSGVSVHTVSPGYINTNLSQSAVTGDGSNYGVKDATTAAGADPDDLAAEILRKVAKGETDFTVAAGTSAVAAIWMRLLCPKILQNLLVKRYEKSQKEKVD